MGLVVTPMHSQFAKPSTSRQLNSTSLQTKEREAVVIPLPIAMNTGQIILLTKMLTATDLRFYNFSAGPLREGWHSP